MQISAFQPPHNFYPQTLRSRLAAFLLSLAMVLLILLALLDMGALGFGSKQDGARLVAIDLGASATTKSSRQHKASETTHANRQAEPEPPHPIPTQSPQPAFIHISHDDFVAADITRMSRHDKNGSDNGTSRGNAAAYGPGEGPGGVQLYNAQWYREPTHAELVTYMPAGAPPGSWAMIACRTIEHFHVDNCEELDESPAGSGLARALRRASWQFLVRPPRIEGKALVGSWVRIRFDFTKSEGRDDAPARITN